MREQLYFADLFTDMCSLPLSDTERCKNIYSAMLHRVRASSHIIPRRKLSFLWRPNSSSSHKLFSFQYLPHISLLQVSQDASHSHPRSHGIPWLSPLHTSSQCRTHGLRLSA